VNLSMLLDMAADGMADRIAIGGASGTTFAELHRRATAGARWLKESGAGVLAYADSNGPAAPVALFAAARAGASYAPLNYRLPAAALGALAGRLDSAVAVAGAPYLPAFDGAATETGAWWSSLDEAGEVDVPDDPERPAVLLFTSGTSAAPKAAVLDHDHLLAYLFGSVEFMSADEDEAVLMSVPPFHIAGVSGTLSSLYSGRRIVPLERFSPEAWLELAQAESITHAFLVPTMVARIVAVMENEPSLRVPSLRSLAYGGARMPVPVLERALDLFPNAGFVNAYGLTETSSTVALLGPDDHRAALTSDDPVVRARLASVGLPLPTVVVQVVDDDGAEVPAGTEGRLRISGDQVSGAYLGVDGSGAGANDGWLVTGDLGWMDAEGYLYVSGRADDVIIRGGENISPSEIEDAVLRHPDVTAAAVVGVPHEEWGEQIAAMVTVRPGAVLDADALRTWLRGEIGSLKTPEVVEVREELPMTDTGKILRRIVRDELTATTATTA
jgi:acyl-CoA synthetase (AMP-forming)/AMP-acid ligase II